MVIEFNKIGLDTKYCCQGGEYYIMFEDYILDSDIIKFLKKYSNEYDNSPFIGKFVKWGRKIKRTIAFNWMYISPNWEFAQEDLKMIKGVK